MTPKQQAFVHHYCTNGGNGTQAAIAAGYSEATAREIASQNLTKPAISQAIDEWREHMAEQAEITIESIARELVKICENATKDKQHSAAVSAQLGVAKLYGLLAEDRKNARDPLTDAMATVAKAEREKRAIH